MNTVEKNLVLKKCASSSELGALAGSNLTLREAKSYAGAILDNKPHNTSPRYQNAKENCLELFCKDYDIQQIKKSGIATKDVGTEETIIVNEEILTHHGQTYTTNDIAWAWKKDCRMWLWKNDKEFMKNRSVAEMRCAT